MIRVVDTCVVAKWFLQEEGSDRAERYLRALEEGDRIAVPSSFFFELAHVLWCHRWTGACGIAPTKTAPGLSSSEPRKAPAPRHGNRGQNGQSWWRWVSPIFGVPHEQVFQMSPTLCHTSSGGTPYGAATSTKPCLSDITGSPPSWAHPHSAGPNPPGPGAAQRPCGAAT